MPLIVKIFRGARRVMAWLDPGGDTTVEQEGMQAIDHLSRLSKIENDISLLEFNRDIRLSKIEIEISDEDFSLVLQFLKLP
jgi:hypothetical protein